MPFCASEFRSEISLENKRKIVEGITKVLVDIGIPWQAITIIISKEQKENWPSGGRFILKPLQTAGKRLDKFSFRQWLSVASKNVK